MTTPSPGIWTAADPALRIERFLELVSPKLLLVEAELRKNFASSVRTIHEGGDHVLQGGGKRIRPALLLLVARMLGYEGSKDVVYGAVVEFIHTATLVHDDVIDEAAVRRSHESLNRRWGNYLAVLFGDYVYLHAMRMALEERNLDILSLLADVTVGMVEGEILGYEQQGRADLTADEYFEVVGRKTAGLFGATCEIAAMISDGSPEVRRAARDYGYNLGVCFQLVDDLLDFTSSTDVLGKPALSDLREGKLTLPLILASKQMADDERSMIQAVLDDRSFDRVSPEAVLDVVHRHDTVRQTLDTAREYAARAREAIQGFAPSAERDALDYAIDFVLLRRN